MGNPKAKMNILGTGTEIKRVLEVKQGKYGFSQIYLPKILGGRYVRVSLLPIEEEKEIIKKVKKAEEFKIEREKEEIKLKKHYEELNKLKLERIRLERIRKK